MRYLHLISDANLPSVADLAPFKAVVIVEDSVSPEWQGAVSDWLVESGCLYMMAWGKNCSTWDDSVDHSNMEAYDYGEIAEDRFVMTTWHSDEPLKEVFWFSKHSAIHPSVELKNTLLLHISKEEREMEYSNEFKDA